ncbi:hypothetical protein SAMN02745146_1046 [Hymenobacter daecheongensis DSM 21074]|uniref:Uncharacterized protein n=1 Tax=Hymenobacter daecheongensis DSM 21074 TaxID=1121955 RepID=A0A1M6C680_9BACT|nr:hypothetical protein [Hymenobacter daecheongensis]SHI56547.1 hypothetical protein SAMN02745146_1046 [Hymenobacter daecheongensis DSM 21074]
MLYQEHFTGGTLFQRSLFSTKYFSITDHKVQIREKNLAGERSVLVPFEEIGRDRLLRLRRRPEVLVLAALVLGGSLLGFFDYLTGTSGSTLEGPLEGIVGAVLLAGAFLLTQQRTLLLANDDQKGLVLFLPLRGEAPAAEEFIRVLLKRRDLYLRQQYGHLSHLIDYDLQLNRLTFLYKSSVISQAEFTARREKLDALFPQKTDMPSGFSFSLN